MNISTTALRGRLGMLLASAVVAVAMPLLSTARTYAAEKPNIYAVGDSVAAGYGAGAIAGSPFAVPCERTTAAYPDVVAATSNLEGFNLACTGATTTAGLNGPQTRNGVTVPSQISQLGDLKKKPTIVTVTIGANDVHWFDFMAACLVLPADCDTPQNTAAFTVFLDAAKPQIATALQAIHARKPLYVAVTGYYDPFGALAPLFGFTPGEVTWYRDRITQLNAALQEVAVANNARYVDIMSLNALTGDVILGNDPLNTLGFAHPSSLGQNKIAGLIKTEFNL